MNANELRIGNWLEKSEQIIAEVGGKYAQITTVYIDKAVVGYHYPLIWYNPIPLTEEWLVKFGFIYDGYDYWEHMKQYFELRDKGDGNYCYCVNCGEYDCSADIKYVHQLQNLFNSITGEELTLNSNP